MNRPMKTLPQRLIIIVLLVFTGLATSSSNRKKCNKKGGGGKKKCHHNCNGGSSSESSERTFDTSDVEHAGIGRVVYRADSEDNSVFIPFHNPFTNPLNPLDDVSPNNGIRPTCPSQNGVSPSIGTLSRTPPINLNPSPSTGVLGGYQPPLHQITRNSNDPPACQRNWERPVHTLYFDPPKPKPPKPEKEYPSSNPFYDHHLQQPSWATKPSSWPTYGGYAPTPPNAYNPFITSPLPSTQMHTKSLGPPIYMAAPNGAQILLNEDYQISVGNQSKRCTEKKLFSIDDDDVCAGFGGLYVITKDVPIGVEAEACAVANGRPANVYQDNLKDVLKSINKCLGGDVELVRVRQYFGERQRGMVLSIDKRYGPGIQHHKDFSPESQPVLCKLNASRNKKKKGNTKRKEKRGKKTHGRRHRKHSSESDDARSSSSSSSSSACSSDT